MKLILTAAVDHLGIAGDIVEVKDGFGRNYLLPQGFAIRWTRGAEKQIEGINRAREARTVRDNEHASELRTQLASTTAESDEDAAEVLALPRRTFTGDAAEWSDLEAPTVVNLDLLRLAAPLLDEVKRAHAN